MQTLSLFQTIAVWFIPVLFAITLHEAGHAWVAARCGDTTAKALGRLSINPIRHIDLIGTILIPIVVAVLSGFQFIFGWAKPVPINWSRLNHPRQDMVWVALAGPLANLIMAILWGICAKIGMIWGPSLSSLALFMVLTGKAGILINLILGLMNLIPIPPLDGSRVVASLLPPRLSLQYMRVEPFGFFILMILLFTGVLGWVLFPPLAGLINLFYRGLGLLG